MSKSRQTVSTVFDLQRTAIESTRRAVTQSAELGKETSRAAIEGLDTSRTVQKKSTEFAKAGLDAYFDAVEAAVPGSEEAIAEVRAAANDGFDQLEAVQDESWTAAERTLEEGVEATESMTDLYLETSDAAFDAFLEAHEHVEAQATEAAETADAVRIDVEDA